MRVRAGQMSELRLIMFMLWASQSRFCFKMIVLCSGHSWHKHECHDHSCMNRCLMCLVATFSASYIRLGWSKFAWHAVTQDSFCQTPPPYCFSGTFWVPSTAMVDTVTMDFLYWGGQDMDGGVSMPPLSRIFEKWGFVHISPSYLSFLPFLSAHFVSFFLSVYLPVESNPRPDEVSL